jgi:EAL domain-containing protein (putative c-di-GMP-specific phosphodiesterase class I)
MPTLASRPLTLPYSNHEHYTISLFAKSGTFSPPLAQALQGVGCKKTAEGVRVLHTEHNWPEVWSRLYEVITKEGAHESLEVKLSGGDGDVTSLRKTPAGIQAIVDGLWLIEALKQDRLLTFYQPVLNRQDKIFGYESFVRVRAEDGDVISGEKVVAASRALGIEYMLDRQLHVQAIKTFAVSDCSGFLFINLFPGFIQRPAVYLEGLSEAVQLYGVVPKNLVLEFTRAEHQKDIRHLKNVCEYGRSKGYSIALDDINTADGAQKLVTEIRPDFVKLDLPRNEFGKQSLWQSSVRELAQIAHAAGSTVVAEGVESEEQYQQLKMLGVDLFQGYLFSPPVASEEAARYQHG